MAGFLRFPRGLAFFTTLLTSWLRHLCTSISVRSLSCAAAAAKVASSARISCLCSLALLTTATMFAAVSTAAGGGLESATLAACSTNAASVAWCAHILICLECLVTALLILLRAEVAESRDGGNTTNCSTYSNSRMPVHPATLTTGTTSSVEPASTNFSGLRYCMSSQWSSITALGASTTTKGSNVRVASVDFRASSLPIL